MSILFRRQLVLMIFGEYAYGDHVVDPRAFERRCRSLFQPRFMENW